MPVNDTGLGSMIQKHRLEGKTNTRVRQSIRKTKVEQNGLVRGEKKARTERMVEQGIRSRRMKEKVHSVRQKKEIGTSYGERKKGKGTSIWEKMLH